MNPLKRRSKIPFTNAWFAPHGPRKTLAAQRAEIVKQMRRKGAPSELADRRAMLTCKIAELRKEDKIAEGAIKRIQRTRESNRIDQENRNQHSQYLML